MERGIVVEIDGGRVLVEAGQNPSCGECAAARSCLIAASGGKRQIWMDNTRGAVIGDEVAFFIDGRAVIAGSVVLYALPAALLVAGAAAGFSLSGRFGADPELAAIAGGVAGLIMSCIIIAIVSSAIKKRELYVPRLVEVTTRRTN